jgi:hypothetical protein
MSQRELFRHGSSRTNELRVDDNGVDRTYGEGRSCYRKITALRDVSRRNREKWRVL